MEDASELDEIKRSYREFFEDERLEGRYTNKLRDAVESGKYRLVVNLNDLRTMRDLDSGLLKNPRLHMIAMQRAAKDVIAGMGDPGLDKLAKLRDLQIGFEGAFGSSSVSPRGLTSQFLNQLVQVEGIVTKVSSVRAKLVKSVHLTHTPADSAWKYSVREHRDHTSADIGLEVDGRLVLPMNALPTKDPEGNVIDMEQGLCVYKDYQQVTLQEMPERARVGQLPRSVEILLEHDLVDRVKPGDRVQVVGLYRAEAREVNGAVDSVFKTKLLGNNVSVIGKEIGSVKLTSLDVAHIKEIAGKEGMLQMLSRALCPSIFGHEFIKVALILQLMGGCERNLENGTHLRGDINIMFVGDPSTAKSQLLRAVLDIAPLAISTTGKGSSGVGLTAAVSMDPETGEKRLEAGAMVLADRGVVCIDEFDKMGENDRTAIHEVMEQQTVTIAKAGIHASLNARCSVVAAANPIYGQYDKSRRPQENIGLPDSLLSRFDLLFIVLDQLDPVIDRHLAEHVVRNHQYRRPGTIMEPESLRAGSLSLHDPLDQTQETPVWTRGGGGAALSSDGSREGDILSKEFLRKFVYYAKAQRPPTLTDEAMELISSAYAQMRSKSGMKNLPVTARTLETIIRLSTASAKTRLSRTVEAADVECATDLVNYVLFHEIGEQMQTLGGLNKRRLAEVVEDEEEPGGDTQSQLTTPSRKAKQGKGKGKGSATSPDENHHPDGRNSQGANDDDDDDDNPFNSQSQSQSQTQSQGRGKARSQGPASSADRMARVKDVVVQLTSTGENVQIDDIIETLNNTRAGGGGRFEEKEVWAVLASMEESNHVLVSHEDRVVMRI